MRFKGTMMMLVIGMLGMVSRGCDCGSESPGLNSSDGILDGSGLDKSVSTDGRSEAGNLDGGTDGAAEPCKPLITDCTGLCGNLLDYCTGEKFECGNCPTNGDTCNPLTNTCMKATSDCKELGAECGLTRNACGDRIDCGTCPNDKECDPDSNTCVDCSNVTCQDLGYECGKAWLGCGPKSKLTDCGPCPDGKVCNSAYLHCEPKCEPASANEICSQAKTERGVECGWISDGCGGLINCDPVLGGCPDGEVCGEFGVANRCDPKEVADLCKVLGKDCGILKNACGKEVFCGECTQPKECSKDNACVTPCATQKSCADYPNQWGDNYFDDGCGGKLPKCSCSNGYVEMPDHTCCKNTATCPTNPGKCDGYSVPDSCTQKPIYCNCPKGTICNKTTDTCFVAKTCADFGASGTTETSKCSTKAISDFDRGDGVNLKCPCKNGLICVTPNNDSDKVGTCCKNTAQCPAPGQPGSCNNSVTNTCDGSEIKCSCPSGYHCDGTTCVKDKTCAEYNATGEKGAICSNDASPSFPTGVTGVNLTCPCDSGLACVDSSKNRVSGGKTGTCLLLKKCLDYQAKGNLGNDCSNGKSPAFPTGVVNEYLKCPCKSAYVCVDNQNQVVSGTDKGVCVAKKTCADYNATGEIGSKCNDNKYYSDGYGGLFACPCNKSGSFFYNTCEGDSTSKEGQCTCAPRACNCTISGEYDGCGKLLSCACPSDATCNAQTLKCCPKATCSSLGLLGKPGDKCGTLDIGAVSGNKNCNGMTINCGCFTGDGLDLNKCTNGVCTCKPLECVDIGKAGTWPDGCGGSINCQA